MCPVPTAGEMGFMQCRFIEGGLRVRSSTFSAGDANDRVTFLDLAPTVRRKYSAIPTLPLFLIRTLIGRRSQSSA